MALKINLYRNNNESSTKYGRVYGRVENLKPIDIDGLAHHMSEHNTPYSKGVIKGILTDMASCIRELMLAGQPVKIADLAIFKASVVSDGAKDAESFDLSKHIKNVKLCAIATGVVTRKELTNEALLEYTSLAQKVREGKVELSMGTGADDAQAGNQG